jgi:uncharacterized protein
MQLSHFIKIYPYDEMPGHLLVYSTKKASISLIPEKIFAAIENNALSPEEEESLSKLGVVVADREEEKREMRFIVDRLNAKDRSLTISVIINMACNFDCIYCYEGTLKGGHYMSAETADLLINFIKGKFAEGKDLLQLDFYGGEPLLSSNLIRQISESLKSLTDQRGASYTFSLVTNGSLLKRKVAEDLVRTGLTAVRITIDGDAETHNRYRPFRTGAGSFDAIIGNIKETYDLVKIGIGGNFDRGTYERFPLLLDYLEKEGLTPGRIHEVRFGPVSKRPDEDTSPADYTDWCLSVNEPWVLEAGRMLREEIMRRGYNTPKTMPTPCQVELTNSYVVNYDGRIYKCPALVGRDGFAIGDLGQGVMEYGDMYGLDLWKTDKCLECVYLPLCFGGCRYMTYVRDGKLGRPDCKRPHFEATLETFVKQDVKFRRAAKTT